MLKRERERRKKHFRWQKKKITILTLIPRYLVLLVIIYDLQRPLLVVQRVQDLVQRWISLLLVQKHDQLIEINRVRFALGAGNKVQVRINHRHHFPSLFAELLTWTGTIPLCRFEGRFCGITRRKRRR